jgi:TolB-like protein/Tfp pilus assembly protein PilF/DNA-binding winged helix-turn-helix (wHTH) protein
MYWQIKYLDERNETVDGLINVLARQGILVQNDVTPLKFLDIDMKGKSYRFAEFELESVEGELRSGFSSIRLQEKPLLLLLTLLDHPQSLVTRDQLRKRMWDSETYVDYEQGINVAVKKVRNALGDSAESPRFIQTVTKKGYRFLSPVHVVPTEVNSPEAIIPTPVGPTPLPQRRIWGRGSVSVWVALAAGTLIILGIAQAHFRASSSRLAPIHSIAVLPLRNLSPEPGQDYFADGITEDLITDLARSLPLRVISRTSVMRYRQSSEPITQIARELGVEAVVEGSVVRSGDRVAVTVQLIDGREDRHLWAQRYERRLNDLLVMETELSQEIATQVGGTLGHGHRVEVAHPAAVDPDVNDLCLLGRHFWNKRTEAGLAKAIDYFQQAIQRDPNYAPAYAGLANAYVILPSYSSAGREASFTKAAAAANRAIQLDESLAESHAAVAFVALNHWATESQEAEREFHRALELNPNSATAHHWFTFYLIFSDRMEEATAELERARQLDPFSAIINADEGHLLYAAGQFEAAKVRLRQAMELAPDLGQPHETLALIDLEEGRSPDAIKEAREGLDLDSGNPRTIAEAGYVLAETGHSAEARTLLVNLNDRIRRGSAFPVFPAFIYMGLGERNRVLEVLTQTAALKVGGGLQGLVQWRIFVPLKSDPRYQKLLAEYQQ